MNRPHRCPVCEGRGSVPIGFYPSYTPAVGWEPCKPCLGIGVLWEREATTLHITDISEPLILTKKATP